MGCWRPWSLRADTILSQGSSTWWYLVKMRSVSRYHIVFAMARNKAAKTMHKKLRDLQRFGEILPLPRGRKWVSEELAVIYESKEVAGDLIIDVALDQVLGDKWFEMFGKYFMSMHFSDQHLGKHKKMLLFKFALSDAQHMDDTVGSPNSLLYRLSWRLQARFPGIGARNKANGARQKAAQDVNKELQNVRQEALQRQRL